MTQGAEEALEIKKPIIGLTGIPDDLVQVEIYCNNHDVIQSTKDSFKSVRINQILNRHEVKYLHSNILTDRQLDVFMKGTVSKVGICCT